MSAAALKLVDELDPREWISLPEAAPLLQKDEGHLRRTCAQKWEGQGLAMRLASPAGSTWYIARRVDACLHAGPLGERNQLPDLRGYTDGQRRGAFARVACVEHFRCARSTDGPGWVDRAVAFLSDRYPDLRISRRTLFNWDKVYQCKADIVKLIDRRGGDQKSKGDPAAWNEFGRRFLVETQPAAKEIWRQVKLWAEEREIAWCTYKSLLRQLNKRFTPQEQAKYRCPAVYRGKFAPYIEQDPERFGAGECLVMDHSQLDFWVRYRGEVIRPWITTAQCWRTRRICGWVLVPSPDSGSVRAALRHAILDPANGGPPDALWLDRGKDFESYVLHGQTKKERRVKVIEAGEGPEDHDFRGILGLFDPPIEGHFSIPYNPNGKSRMERWYSTLHGAFDKSMATYCGRNPLFRPENLADTLKESPELIPTYEEVQQWLGDFIRGFNASADHNIEDLREHGRAISPDEAMKRWRKSIRPLPDPMVLDLLLAHWEKPAYVGRNGVTLRIGSVRLTYGQFSGALAPYKGVNNAERRKVRIAYDPQDLRTINVLTEDLAFISTERENTLGGRSDKLGMEYVKELNREKARYNKAKKIVDARPVAHVLTHAEQLAIMAHQDEVTRPETDAIKRSSTKLDDQLPAIKRDKLRKAAGAESMSAPAAPRRNAAPAADIRQFIPSTPEPDRSLEGASVTDLLSMFGRKTEPLTFDHEPAEHPASTILRRERE